MLINPPKSACLALARVAWVLAMLVPALLLGQAADSQTASPQGKPLVDLRRGAAFELYPHTGAMGGSGVFGLRASMNYRNLNLEFSGAQVIGESANLYPLMLNLLVNLTTHGRVLPYGVVGGGLFLTVPTNAIGSETVSTLGGNFGGGARFFLTDRFGIRFEARQYLTNINHERDSREELIIFQEFSLGVTFLFQ